MPPSRETPHVATRLGRARSAAAPRNACRRPSTVVCIIALQARTTRRPGLQCGRFHPLDSFNGLMRTCKVQLARHAERQRQRRIQKRAATGAAGAGGQVWQAPPRRRPSEEGSGGEGAACGAFQPLQPRAVRPRWEAPTCAAGVPQEPLLLLTAAEALAAPQAGAPAPPATPRPAQAQLLAEWSAALDGSGALRPWQPAAAPLLPAAAGWAGGAAAAPLLQSGALGLWAQQAQQQQQQQPSAAEAAQAIQALGLSEQQLYWLGRLADLVAGMQREEEQRAAAAAAAAAILQQPLWA
jgi:hypothetical protein